MANHKEPVVRLSGNRLITTSLAVSNHFQKAHKEILRSIQNLDCSQEFRERNFALSSYNTSQNKKLPMYEITRDGFVFLCMGFTGAQASAWKEKYIAAFNEMEAAITNAPTSSPLFTHLEAHLEQLARGMNVVLTQNQLVHKYIALLEMNQRSKRRIERGDEAVIHQLKAEGMTQADIARLLRISTASVSLILRGKYPFSDAPQKQSIETVLNTMLEREKDNVAQLLGQHTQGGNDA